jgi:Zn-dependent M28 family amino/carboxypeptidase
MDAQGEAPGANDDASGTVAVMAMACALARSPRPPMPRWRR